ncbi:MAG: type II toxin-antitoxin system Phd/YefM family antitoxin [Nitrospirota bacterium]
MEKTISATEAVRRFSELLNTIKFKGNHYIILRGGKPVASMVPVEVSSKGHTIGEIKELLKKIPRLGDEANLFEIDLREIIRCQPGLPEEDKWG